MDEQLYTVNAYFISRLFTSATKIHSTKATHKEYVLNACMGLFHYENCIQVLLCLCFNSCYLDYFIRFARKIQHGFAKVTVTVQFVTPSKVIRIILPKGSLFGATSKSDPVIAHKFCTSTKKFCYPICNSI